MEKVICAAACADDFFARYGPCGLTCVQEKLPLTEQI